jgi:hypothetical protein
MAFINEARIAELDKAALESEGKFVKFQLGVERVFKLVSHSTEERSFYGEKKIVDVLAVVDVKTGDAKEITPSKGFMKALRGINDTIESGDKIRVLPSNEKVFTNDKGEEQKFLEFTITKFEGIEELFG